MCLFQHAFDTYTYTEKIRDRKLCMLCMCIQLLLGLVIRRYSDDIVAGLKLYAKVFAFDRVVKSAIGM